MFHFCQACFACLGDQLFEAADGWFDRSVDWHEHKRSPATVEGALGGCLLRLQKAYANARGAFLAQGPTRFTKPTPG